MDLSTAKGNRIPFIPGTKPSIKNSQLLISTGIPSLDHIIGQNYIAVEQFLSYFILSYFNLYVIGGGLPVGSLFLIGM